MADVRVMPFPVSRALSASAKASTTSEDNPAPFGHAQARMTLGSLDDDKLQVVAQYNPKELQYDRTVNWTQQNQMDNRPAHLRQMPSEDQTDDFEYKSSSGRALTIELFFDGYEKNLSVEQWVGKLELMATVRDPEHAEEHMRRPHYCVVSWGTDMKPFRCIIQSLAVKYTMFDKTGRPLRVSCTVKLQEAQLRLGRAKNPPPKRTA